MQRIYCLLLISAADAHDLNSLGIIDPLISHRDTNTLLLTLRRKVLRKALIKSFNAHSLASSCFRGN